MFINILDRKKNKDNNTDLIYTKKVDANKIKLIISFNNLII